MSFFTIKGIQFFYEEKGKGENLIFVHAGVADSRMWDSQFEYFSEFFRVIRYDLRGFGKTGFSEEEYNDAEDLKALFDYLQVTKAHLVGCSKGGQIIVDFALQFPTFVNSLCLVNSLPNGFEFDELEPNILWTALESVDETDFKKRADLETMIWFVGQSRTKDEVQSELYQKVVEMDLIAIQNRTQISPRVKVFFENASTKLENFSAPIAFIDGILDEPFMVKGAKDLSKKLGAQLYLIENTAHLPSVERPKEFNESLKKFLNPLN